MEMSYDGEDDDDGALIFGAIPSADDLFLCPFSRSVLSFVESDS